MGSLKALLRNLLVTKAGRIILAILFVVLWVGLGYVMLLVVNSFSPEAALGIANMLALPLCIAMLILVFWLTSKVFGAISISIENVTIPVKVICSILIIAFVLYIPNMLIENEDYSRYLVPELLPIELTALILYAVSGMALIVIYRMLIKKLTLSTMTAGSIIEPLE